MSIEARLKELGIILPAAPKPVANDVPVGVRGFFVRLRYFAGAGWRVCGFESSIEGWIREFVVLNYGL